MAARSHRHEPTELVSAGWRWWQPVIENVRGAIVSWRDPRARMVRRRRRAVRATVAWCGLTLLGAVGLLAQGAHLLSLGGIAVMVVTAVFGYCATTSGIKTVRLHRLPLPDSPAPVTPLPPNGSLAREPLRRLAEAESGLADLLAQLGTPTSVGITPVPVESVVAVRAAAVEASAVIRALSAQLRAVERARDIAPAARREPLAEGARRLRAQLDEGVDGYRTLVAAAGQAVVASSAGAPGRPLLTEASEELSGLAQALRELSPGP
ncbi:MAG: hypothetical protein JOZ47_12450 [Kutzneria sp.]|nr:hypothetical protein [Kutzneria sp.]MBV9845871.1 hypothetical protein [Kutzneria sp.]